MSFLHLVVLALATWRLSSLISAEEGPYNIFGRFRIMIGIHYIGNGVDAETELGKLFSCTWCLSIWIGAIASVAYVIYEPIVWIVMPLALSAAAIIVGKLTES